MARTLTEYTQNCKTCKNWNVKKGFKPIVSYLTEVEEAMREAI
jgi:hypothetical protein